MADDAARHISQAKRFRRSLATGPTTSSDSPIDGWRSKRGPPPLEARRRCSGAFPRAVASFRLAALRTRAPSISPGMSMRPRVFQARCRIEAQAAPLACVGRVSRRSKRSSLKVMAASGVTRRRTPRRPTPALPSSGASRSRRRLPCSARRGGPPRPAAIATPRRIRMWRGPGPRPDGRVPASRQSGVSIWVRLGDASCNEAVLDSAPRRRKLRRSSMSVPLRRSE
jgi:hypothetical protein